MTTTRKTVDLYVTHMNNRPQSTITTLETSNAAHTCRELSEHFDVLNDGAAPGATKIRCLHCKKQFVFCRSNNC